MKKQKIIVTVLIIVLIIIGTSYRSVKTTEKIEHMTDVAQDYLKEKYPEVNFEFSAQQYNRHDHSYTITFKNTADKTDEYVSCKVTPTVVKDRYAVTVVSAINTEIRN